jgi:hypothetical protein
MVSLTLALFLTALGAEKEAGLDDYLGKWDIMLLDTGTTFNACWWKVEKNDGAPAASLVWRWGSVVPAQKVEVSGGEIRMVTRDGKKETTFRAKLEGDRLAGSVQDPDGKTYHFEGKRAPDLRAPASDKWGKPLDLFDGKTLQGWRLRDAGAGKMGWEAKDGALVNSKPGMDLVTERRFKDFKLHLEFNVDKHSNSGIYLRGRYEVQILDDYGKPVEPHGNGAVYSRLAPRQNVSKPAGEWQTCDITLIGRELTVSLNGKPIIEKGHLDGITGGALSAYEDEAGPLLLQGDHGKVSFRNIVLTPLE